MDQEQVTNTKTMRFQILLEYFYFFQDYMENHAKNHILMLFVHEQ